MSCRFRRQPPDRPRTIKMSARRLLAHGRQQARLRLSVLNLLGRLRTGPDDQSQEHAKDEAALRRRSRWSDSAPTPRQDAQGYSLPERGRETLSAAMLRELRCWACLWGPIVLSPEIGRNLGAPVGSCPGRHKPKARGAPNGRRGGRRTGVQGGSKTSGSRPRRPGLLRCKKGRRRSIEKPAGER